MRNDQIFVLLLVILIPLSGCFDPGVGEVDAEESGLPTVVNHYHNNTTIVYENTTVVNNQSNPILYTASGYAGECTSWTNTTDESGTESRCNNIEEDPVRGVTILNLENGTTAKIHAAFMGQHAGTFYYHLDCTSGLATSSQLYLTTYNNPGTTIPADQSSCHVSNGVSFYGYWSIVYEIVELSS